MVVNFSRDLWGEESPGLPIRLALIVFLFCHVSVFNFAGYQEILIRFSKKDIKNQDERKPDYI